MVPTRNLTENSFQAPRPAQLLAHHAGVTAPGLRAPGEHRTVAFQRREGRVRRLQRLHVHELPLQGLAVACGIPSSGKETMRKWG